MFHLDLTTLILISAGITFMMGILMTYLWKIAPQVKGPGYWSTGAFLVSTGILVYGIYPISGDYGAFVIAGTMVLTGLCFFLAGIWKFKEVKFNYWIFFGLPLVQLLQGTIFLLIFPVTEIRMLFYSLLNVLFAILATVELLRPSANTFKSINRIGALVFFTYGIVMTLRAFESYFFTPESAIQATKINMALFFVSGFSQVLMTFVFVIMVNRRMADELNKQISTRNKFFSIISHDLIGPIGTISESLKVFQASNTFANDNQQNYFNELSKVSDSTYQLLKDLLHWSRNQYDNLTVQTEIIDLNKIIKENILLLQQMAHMKSIHIDYNDCEINCKGDKRMIDTAIRNLLSNAIKFTNTDGSIYINCFKDRNESYIKIKDTGVGMSKEVLNNLFSFESPLTRLGTQGEKGRGLGLFLSKEFIEKNSGKLHIDSKKDEGTEVTLCFPNQ